MPTPPPDPDPASSAGQLRSGDSPFALYWAMPAATAIVLLVLALILPMVAPSHARAILWTVAIAAAVLLPVSIFQTFRQLRWEAVGNRRRLEAMELLTNVSAALGTETGAEQIILQRLPSTVHSMLGMKMACVGILEDDGKMLRIAATHGMEPLLGRRIPLDQLPMSGQCVVTKSVVSLPDTRRATFPFNAKIVDQSGTRSILMVPLICEDRVIGLIAVADDRPRPFTPTDLRRAALWGRQASLTVANSRFYAQMIHSARENERILKQRNTLFDLNSAIQTPGELRDVLQRIVELAPAPLQVDAALVWLIADDNLEQLTLGAATHPFGPSIQGFRISLKKSITQEVLASREPLVVENGVTDVRLNSQLKTVLPHGSLIFEPLLRRDGQPLGVLVLMRREPGAFLADQLDLARLFSLRAAAVIEMARLYDQTRGDADAKAMLLRELNHRVKNNLASIVSLLSINQPELLSDARQWLNRCIDRISAMAQVHDLYSGVPRRVSLAELIDRTVQSLSVVKPPDVVVMTDLPSCGPWLRTDRAVSLSMAIHELCFNGIVHGLGQKGTLTIRAACHDGQLTAAVEDDAGRPLEFAASPQNAPQAARFSSPQTERPVSDRPVSSRSGIGLTLVRGLVGRELHGQFTLAPAPGGTLATLQFPLLPDEMRDAAV